MIKIKDIQDDIYIAYLFQDVYYSYSLEWEKHFFWHRYPWDFVAGCTASEGLIQPENGHCSKCKKFIAPFKMLEVMRGLKELTG